jgi:hypothetical protein
MFWCDLVHVGVWGYILAWGYSSGDIARGDLGAISWGYILGCGAWGYSSWEFYRLRMDRSQFWKDCFLLTGTSSSCGMPECVPSIWT